MWITNYIREWKAWRTVKKVYDANKTKFESIGLKRDWFGRIYKVINRDPSIPLGTAKDEELLQEELKEISDLLVSLNLMDILAYELLPQESSDEKTFENAYLVKLTPAWDIRKQYVSFWSTTLLFLFLCGAGVGLYYLINWLM